MFRTTYFLVTSNKLLTKRFLSMSTKKSWQEIAIPVPWGYIQGKWWGPMNARPVLCLHGWQDNCGTFDRLIPQLNDKLGYLAIDFPGHGYSSKLPAGMYYHSADYTILVRYLFKYFKWEKISLIGHSLGGITSYVYSMLYPNSVDFVVCIDGAKPMIRRNNNEYVAKAIEQFFKYEQFHCSKKEPPSYTLDEIRAKIAAPNNNSVLLENTDYLMYRNIAPSKVNPGKYYFTRDPRLKVGALVNYPQDELVEYAQNITCPILIAKAKQGSYYELKQNFYEVLDVVKRSSKDCAFHYVEGTHHVHLNNPENVSGLINEFMEKHDIEDRSKGGAKDELIVPKEKNVLQQ